MGMRKRWSRLITVGGVRFRYHVAEDRFEGLGLRICIQQVEPAGQRLLSGFRKPLEWTNVPPMGCRVGKVIPSAVTPRVIRQLILAALTRDWRPRQTGLAPFGLPGYEVVPELPKPAEQSAAADSEGM